MLPERSSTWAQVLEFSSPTGLLDELAPPHFIVPPLAAFTDIKLPLLFKDQPSTGLPIKRATWTRAERIKATHSRDAESVAHLISLVRIAILLHTPQLMSSFFPKYKKGILEGGKRDPFFYAKLNRDFIRR